jgi:hypothetical protein
MFRPCDRHFGGHGKGGACGIFQDGFLGVYQFNKNPNPKECAFEGNELNIPQQGSSLAQRRRVLRRAAFLSAGGPTAEISHGRVPGIWPGAGWPADILLFAPSLDSDMAGRPRAAASDPVTASRPDTATAALIVFPFRLARR